MLRPFARITTLAALLFAAAACAQDTPPAPLFQRFDVATIRPVEPDAKAAQYITMQGTHRFVVKNYTVKLLIAAAYNLNQKTISGGPAWVESDRYDLTAIAPGESRPTHDQQMTMLRALLEDRFKLASHREPRDYSIYALEVAKGGPKLTASTASTDDPPIVGPAILYQGSTRVKLPVRNATLEDFAVLMQRAILDRPVLNRTGLTARYDFDLEWAADETQFGGSLPTSAAEPQVAPLFTAIQEQLGLRLVPTKGPVQALIVDRIERPSAD